MTSIIKSPNNNEKLAVCTGVNINGIYRYLEIIESLNTLTTSGHSSHHFGTSPPTDNYTEHIQPVIADICFQ